MGFIWPEEYDNDMTETEIERLRKRFRCRHEWPEGADKTEVGCSICGYRAIKEIDPMSEEGLAILRQFLQSQPKDYIQLVAPIPLSEIEGEE